MKVLNIKLRSSFEARRAHLTAIGELLQESDARIDAIFRSFVSDDDSGAATYEMADAAVAQVATLNREHAIIVVAYLAALSDAAIWAVRWC